MAGEALHSGGFYHGALSPEAVGAALDMVSDLIKVVEEISPPVWELTFKNKSCAWIIYHSR